MTLAQTLPLFRGPKAHNESLQLSLLVAVGLLHGMVFALLLRPAQTITPPTVLQAFWLGDGESGKHAAAPTQPAAAAQSPSARHHLRPSVSQPLSVASATTGGQAQPSAVPSASQNSTNASQGESAGAAKTIGAPGGVTSAPRFDADYLSNPSPDYPRRSRQAGERGRVLLRVLVSAAGSPLDIAIHHSSGYERLDDAAKSAVGRWKFVPARRGSEAVQAWVIVPINFILNATS